MDDLLFKIQKQDNYYLGKSEIHGIGVFSKKFIKKGSFINYHFIPKNSHPYYKITEIGAHINHSKEPNAISKRINSNLYLIYSIKNILPNDEITLDYTVNKELEQPKSWW